MATPLGGSFESGGKTYELNPNILCSKSVRELLALHEKRLREAWATLVEMKPELASEDYAERAKTLADERVAFAESRDFSIALRLIASDLDALVICVKNSCPIVRDQAHAEELVDEAPDLSVLINEIIRVANATSKAAGNSEPLEPNGDEGEPEATPSP